MTRRWIIAALLLCGALSCSDPQTPEYDNPHDPAAAKYVPTAPTNLAAAAGEASRLLTWRDNSKFEAGYRVERSLGRGGARALIGVTAPNASRFTDTAIIRTDTTYTYWVSAVAASGRASPPESLDVIVPFHAPADLRMTCLSPASVLLEWADSSSFESGFAVLRSTNGGPLTEVARAPANAASFLMEGLLASERYRIAVRAFTPHNASRESGEIAISHVSQPARLLYERSHSHSGAAVSSLIFSPDGREIACGGEYSVDILRAGDGALVARLPHDYNYPVSSVRYSPDGRTIATGHGGSVYLWDARTSLRLSRFYRYGTNSISAVRFTPDGSMIYAEDESGYLQRWNVADGGDWGSFRSYNMNNWTFDISPDGQYFASGDVLMTFRLSDGIMVRSFPSSEFLRSIRYHPSGTLLASAGANDYHLQLWNAADGSLVWSVQELYYLLDIAFDRDGDRVTVAGRTDGAVNIWNVADGSLLLRLEAGTRTRSVAFSPLNNLLAAGLDNGVIKVWGFSGAWRTEF